MPISVDDVETIRNALRALPRNEPKQVTKQEAIASLASELGAAQRRGYSAEDLARLISEKGIEINSMALKNYLRQSRKPKKGGRSKSARPMVRSIAASTNVVPPPPSTPAAQHGGREGDGRGPATPTAVAEEHPGRK